MGATKRLSEIYVQALSQKLISKTNFTIVRFGNVLDSSGSVIPIFKKQIQYGGPLTLSASNVTRYFMTIPEASSLVIQASAMSKKGDIFVLDMGKPIKIFDLAVKMIRLSGRTIKDESNKNGDIEIVIKGLYPGEKLHEDLLLGSNPLPTEHPKILKVKDNYIELDNLNKKLDELKILLERGEIEKIIIFFNNLSDEFNLENNSLDWNLVNKK
jgi:FlaA1/EpsC-like NDP-sugar epimerase